MDSGNGGVSTAMAGAGSEVFALTDEQILGMEVEEANIPSTEEPRDSSHGHSTAAATGAAFAGNDGAGDLERKSDGVRGRKGGVDTGEGLAPEGVRYTEPPKWLAREMNDPWVGEEARELWANLQSSQREAAGYRELIGTQEDARALREIYPGGVREARSAAERARELAEIDAAVFGEPGRGAEVVERLYAQEPGAVREMVEAGIRLLERSGRSGKVTSGEWRVTSGREEQSVNAEIQRTQRSEDQQIQVAGAKSEHGEAAQAGASFEAHSKPVPQVVSAYREFERAANAELERSVGGAISRAMEAALPNLRRVGSFTNGEDSGGKGQAAQLQDRLQAAVKEEVEAGLRSDAALGEQVARVLSGKRFDPATRAQVVRLIDARAQQLVPGAVRKVVGSWTAATLGRKKTDSAEGPGKSIGATRAAHQAPAGSRNERNRAVETERRLPRGRVDYRKWSDEQILEM